MVTSRISPISRRLRSRCLNRITDPRPITFSERILESWAITSSVIPSAKNSFSGSALRLRNGSTATDGGRDRAAAGALSAWAKAAAVGNRSAGERARAAEIAASTAAGTAGRIRRTPGPGW